MASLLRTLSLALASALSCAVSAMDHEPLPHAASDTGAGGLHSAAEGLRASGGEVFDLPNHHPRVLTLDLTRDANDIWDRIRRGFGMADLDSSLVVEQQLFYLNRPGFLKRVFERGGRYLYHIVDELERRGMPTELALLPMVESSYNPMAYSRAHASGLWQFIPSTGRSYNLTQDKWVDERRDVIASTAAALDYLQTIYEMHGDWQLALASYNWGENAVARAVQRNLADGQPAEYRHLRMPEETRNYIPKLQALKNIVARPELFGFELPYVANRRHFVAIEAPAGIDLASAARLADMTLEEFVALNPGYNRPALTGEGRSLVVPVDRAEQFQLRLAEHQSSEKRWRTYQLKQGETLASVARNFGLSLAQLHQLNGLDARSRVSPGYTLLVPDGADPAGALAAAQLVPRISLASAKTGARTPAATAKAPAKPTRTASGASAAKGGKTAAKPQAGAKPSKPKAQPAKGAAAKAQAKKPPATTAPRAPAKPAPVASKADPKVKQPPKTPQ